MSTLSDKSIRELCKNGLVQPCNFKNIESASIDLHLGKSFLIIDERIQAYVSVKEEVKYQKVETYKDDEGEEFIIISPGEFMLATTYEWINIPNNCKAQVEGRSSIGRIGLQIQNAGHIDPGFKGEITLELKNDGPLPIRLYPGRRVCQLVIDLLDSECKSPYQGKYISQEGATGSRIDKDEN